MTVCCQGTTVVLSDCLSECEASEHYGLVMRILRPALHDPFSHYPDVQHERDPGKRSRGTEWPLPAATRLSEVLRHGQSLALFSDFVNAPATGTSAVRSFTTGSNRVVGQQPAAAAASDHIAVTRESEFPAAGSRRLALVSDTVETRISDVSRVLPRLVGCANSSMDETAGIARRKIALKTLAAPPEPCAHDSRKRRRVVSKRAVVQCADDHNCGDGTSGGRGNRQRTRAGVRSLSLPLKPPSHTSSASIEFKVDVFTPMDTLRFPYYKTGETISKERSGKDELTTDATKVTYFDPDDVEEQWPLSQRICGLCGGDDASAIRMLGECWDGKSLADEACCDYDGQVPLLAKKKKT